MAKKRKSEATRLDEVDRTLHSTFCSAANSLSQLYTQAMHHQRISSQAGERHALVRSPLAFPSFFEFTLLISASPPLRLCLEQINPQINLHPVKPVVPDCGL